MRPAGARGWRVSEREPRFSTAVDADGIGPERARAARHDTHRWPSPATPRERTINDTYPQGGTMTSPLGTLGIGTSGTLPLQQTPWGLVPAVGQGIGAYGQAFAHPLQQVVQALSIVPQQLQQVLQLQSLQQQQIQQLLQLVPAQLHQLQQLIQYIPQQIQQLQQLGQPGAPLMGQALGGGFLPYLQAPSVAGSFAGQQHVM
jgi:hypothetical protein